MTRSEPSVRVGFRTEDGAIRSFLPHIILSEDNGVLINRPVILLLDTFVVLVLVLICDVLFFYNKE